MYFFSPPGSPSDPPAHSTNPFSKLIPLACHPGSGAFLPLVQLKMRCHHEQTPLPLWAFMELRSRAGSEAQLTRVLCTPYLDVL